MGLKKAFQAAIAAAEVLSLKRGGRRERRERTREEREEKERKREVSTSLHNFKKLRKTSKKRSLFTLFFPSPPLLPSLPSPASTTPGAWHTPHYTTNNQWVWPGESVNRHWTESDFPMPVRVTSVTGEIVEDVIPKGGGDGTKQFKPVGSLAFESQIMPGYGKRANNYAAFVHPAVAAGQSLWKPETPKSAIGTEANTGKTFSAATLYIKDGEQCGGLAGACVPRDVGQPTKPCIASQWPLAVCESSSSICLPSEGEGVQGGTPRTRRYSDACPGTQGGRLEEAMVARELVLLLRRRLRRRPLRCRRRRLRPEAGSSCWFRN